MSDDPSHQLEGWHSSPEYQSFGLKITVSKFSEVSDVLLERPNLNSSHLFRADILHDSTGKLQTIAEKVRAHQQQLATTLEPSSVADEAKVKDALLPMHNHDNTTITNGNILKVGDDGFDPLNPYSIPGFRCTRTVVRRLIPRKPKVDRQLEQSCFVYTAEESILANSPIIVVYVPHVLLPSDVPWYHPQVRALAYRYDPSINSGTLTVCYKPFADHRGPIPNRTHRTLLALTQTFARLCRMDAPATGPIQDEKPLVSARPVNPASMKDTILPQHVVQDTYTRLKQTYASDLIARWVEKTEPSKHVFEDIGIAAFLVELWKTMYPNGSFPGFVDIACGNGVLVYILTREGYAGRGFDARKRRTWEILHIDDRLEEALCIPQPFLDALTAQEIRDTFGATKIQDGTREAGTFIISNHADELTVWTPILAALSHKEQHLPFLVIPCCSHALSGARHRYSPKDVDAGSAEDKKSNDACEPQNPASGDLRALRAEKVKAASHSDDKSTYACLTKKTVALAEELGFETEMTLIRIPSTRNLGIVGNRHLSFSRGPATVDDQIERLLQRECSGSGGVEAAGKIWIERARKLIEGQGRGKVNLKGVVDCVNADQSIDAQK